MRQSECVCVCAQQDSRTRRRLGTGPLSAAHKCTQFHKTYDSEPPLRRSSVPSGPLRSCFVISLILRHARRSFALCVTMLLDAVLSMSPWQVRMVYREGSRFSLSTASSTFACRIDAWNSTLRGFDVAFFFFVLRVPQVAPALLGSRTGARRASLRSGRLAAFVKFESCIVRRQVRFVFNTVRVGGTLNAQPQRHDGTG